MSRKTAREVAMKIAFANLLGGDAEYIDALSDLSDIEERPLPTEEDIKFANELKTGVLEHAAELDERIQTHLNKWDVDRLPKIELIILRIAMYELEYEPNVPRGAIINEAVRLAKKFGGDSATSYINGVLGAYVRSLGGETQENAEESSQETQETETADE